LASPFFAATSASSAKLAVNGTIVNRNGKPNRGISGGELDAKNEFHATLNLSKDHSNLQDTDWKRFEDLRYAAYVTDASSKRTQERHFDVRISRDAIHLYVLNIGGALPIGLRPVLYVSSSLADGTPAAADVLVKLYTQDPSDTTSLKHRPSLLPRRTSALIVTASLASVSPSPPKGKGSG